MSVGADAGGQRKVCGGLFQDRMYPVRGNIGQRPHDESPLMGPGVGNLHTSLPDHRPTMGDQIKVQRARRVRLLPHPAEIRLDGVKSGQGFGDA